MIIYGLPLLWYTIWFDIFILKYTWDITPLFYNKSKYFVEGYVGLLYCDRSMPHYYNTSMQERRNSIANALDLRLSCTNPSTSAFTNRSICYYCRCKNIYLASRFCVQDFHLFLQSLIAIGGFGPMIEYNQEWERGTLFEYGLTKSRKNFLFISKIIRYQLKTWDI